MLDSSFIERIEKMAQSEIKDIDGTKFQVRTGGVSRIEFPERDIVQLFSLTQMIDFIHMELDAHPDDNFFVNIPSYHKVYLAKRGLNRNRKLDVIACADFTQMFAMPDQSSAGQGSYDQENFMVYLLTKFAATPSRGELIALTSSLKAGKTSTAEDDGISQVATVKSGVHLASGKKIKNLWNLKTYRTFPEVEQPVIPYVLRLTNGYRGRNSESEDVGLMLLECDGGMWKVDLTIAVRAWIKKNLVDSRKKVAVL